MNKKAIRLLIADDHPVVISGVKNSLATSKRIRVVGEATNGPDAIAAVKQLAPDIILLDIAMPGMNGLQITRKLAKLAPNVKILAFTMHDDREYILEVVQAGARGYVLKETSTSELIHAIETVFEDGTFFSPSVAQVLLDDQYGGSGGRRFSTVSMLTEREREILTMLAQGMSNKLVADKLRVSLRTVQTHRQKIMKKLDIHSAVDLTRFAIERGLSDIQNVK